MLTASKPISYQGIISHLVGLDHWLENAGRSRSAYTQASIEKMVPAAIRRFEAATHFRIGQAQVITSSDGSYTADGKTSSDPAYPGTPVIKEGGYTFYREDARNFFRVVLKTKPVQVVQRLRIVYQGAQIFSVPRSWYSVDGNSGQFEIVPYYGAAFGLGVSQAFSVMQANLGCATYLPNALQFDYIAGLPAGVLNTASGLVEGGWWDDPEWAHLRDGLEKYLALEVLKDISQLADAGLTNVSTQGDSRNYSRFMDRKKELSDDFEMFKRDFVDTQTPIVMSCA